MINKTLMIILFLPIFIRAQIDFADMPFINLKKNVAKLKGSVLSIEKKDETSTNYIRIGSGFMARINNNQFAVTNRHVIGNLNKEQIKVGFNQNGKKHYAIIESVKLHKSLDIAILKLSDKVTYDKNSPQDSTLSQLISITASIFGDNSKLIEGTGILVIGFPLGIGIDFTGNEPISRIGIIAQSVNNNGTFIMDGTVSHGNSGSPVFDAQTRHLLGMIMSFPSDKISAFDERGNLIVSLPYNSGLTICISANKILEFLKEY